MARPRKDPEELRDAIIRLRFSESEKQELQDFVSAANLILAPWARDTLLGIARSTNAVTENPLPATQIVIPTDAGLVEVSVRVIPSA